MTKLIDSIVNKDYITAKNMVNEKLEAIAERKMVEVKKMVAAKKVVEQEQDFIIKHQTNDRRERLKRDITEEIEQIDEAVNVQKIGRTKLIRVRIRGGKVQRRKKVSAVPGMTLRGGKLIRMSPAERRHRKLGARKGKLKRRSKKTMMLRKRKLSLMKRQRLGL